VPSAGPLPTLQGERVVLRPARAEADAAAVAAILAEPEAARWWGEEDVAGVREHMLSQPSFVVEIDGSVAGWLHVHEETDPQYPSVAFDIVLASRLHGRGYGREVLRVAIGWFASRGHHRFTIDPAAANEAAIRCYTAVGFKPVGVLRAYERAPDGTWRDGLLMDLLASEFDASAQ
jgi:aminoglycoside 6'-N-acetyltransferase